MNYKAESKSLTDIMFDLSDTHDFDFSFDARIQTSVEKINLDIKDQTLRVSMSQISNSFGVKSNIKGRQVIISGVSEEEQRSYNLLSGWVRDFASGDPLKEVEVSERFLNLNGVSNEEGKFELKVNNPSYILYLEFKKEGYRLNQMKVKITEDKDLYVLMHKLGENDVDPEVTTESKSSLLLKEEISVPVVKSVLSRQTDTNKTQELFEPVSEEKWARSFIKDEILDGISDDSTLYYYSAQFGIWPGLSSEGSRAINSTYNFSLNLLTGLSAGTKGAEVNTLVGVDRFNVIGSQVSGLASVAGGSVTGAQVSGITSKTKMKVNGFQGGGITAYTGLNLRGAQVGGISSVVRGEIQGIQVGGIQSMATKQVVGVQVGGIVATVNEHLEGAQIAGILNTSRTSVKGIQISGLINLTDEIEGAQIAGILNYANRFNGFQLGFINVIDSMENGMALGFFSFVKNGYRRHEIMGNESGIVNYQFKSGVNSFYNIFAVGAKPQTEEFLWNFGYGIGMMIKPEKKVFGSLELVSYSLHNEQWSSQLNLLNKFNLNIGIKLHNRWALTLGPSANVYLAHKSLNFDSDIIPYKPVYTTTSEELNISGWFGFNAGIQF